MFFHCPIYRVIRGLLGSVMNSMLLDLSLRHSSLFPIKRVSATRTLLPDSDYTGTPETSTTAHMKCIMQGSACGGVVHVCNCSLEPSRSELNQWWADLSTADMNTHFTNLFVHVKRNKTAVGHKYKKCS